MKQLPYSSLVLGMMIASLLTACGGGGGSSSTNTTTSTSASDITVERGPLLFTNLIDSYGFPATSQGEGHYAFTNNTPTYPLKTTGGYIDVNRNGIIDAGDVKAGELSLTSFGTGVAITIASSLANNSDIKNKLLALGFTEDQLANQTPSQDRMIAGLSDEVYAYIVENTITDLSHISGEQFETISSKIQSRIANYQASSATVSQLESVLMTELSSLLGEQKITETLDTSTLSNQILVLNSLPTYTLTEAQKDSLYYMWNEEKLAKELYLALNAVYPANSLANIATNSETQHVNSMEGLLDKYQLTQNLIDQYNQSHPDDAPVTQLSEIPAGVFTIPSLQTLYNSLYQEGIASANASLLAGCKVEVTDVNDLDEKIASAEATKDLIAFFEVLRAGSYNHYWSFDNGLKKAGVTEGCCSLGSDFCRTEAEFPKTSLNGGGANAGGNAEGNGQGLQKGKP